MSAWRTCFKSYLKEDQVQILSYLADERAAQVLEEMEPDDAADLLIELDDVQREKLLELMEPDEADDVRRLLEYDEGTAGSLMNPVPIILSPEATVAEALAHIRAEEISPAMAAAVLVARPPPRNADRQIFGAGAYAAAFAGAAERIDWPHSRHRHRTGL